MAHLAYAGLTGIISVCIYGAFYWRYRTLKRIAKWAEAARELEARSHERDLELMAKIFLRYDELRAEKEDGYVLH